MLLNCSDRTRTGAFNMICPLMVNTGGGRYLGLTWKGEVAMFLILDPKEPYISNLSLLACLEPLEKVPVGGGWWWLVGV